MAQRIFVQSRSYLSVLLDLGQNTHHYRLMKRLERPPKKKLKEILAARDSAAFVYYALRTIVLLIMAVEIFIGNYQNAFQIGRAHV